LIGPRGKEHPGTTINASTIDLMEGGCDMPRFLE
jgi:hypothetical protein